MLKEVVKGVAFGMGIALALPIVLPIGFAVARPLTKSAIRAYLNVKDAVSEPRRSVRSRAAN